jgi:hypothetical protein
LSRTSRRPLNEISRPDREGLSQAPKHCNAHRCLRALDLTHVAGAETNPIREVLLSPPARVPKTSNIRRNCLLQIGHGASGRCRHDRSRNDASYSSSDLLRHLNQTEGIRTGSGAVRGANGCIGATLTSRWCAQKNEGIGKRKGHSCGGRRRGGEANLSTDHPTFASSEGNVLWRRFWINVRLGRVLRSSPRRRISFLGASY